MHAHKNTTDDKLQRRFLIGVVIFAIIATVIAVPLIVNEELRYDLTMRTGQIPGQDVEKLAEGDEGALLVVIPVDHDVQGLPTPWLFRAQFIAWPVAGGLDLENLETGERTQLPLEQIEFIAANGDGSLILMRGHDAGTGKPLGLTVNPSEMEVEVLASADAVPDEPGDWDTSIWEKQGQRCHRPSPGQRFLVCFENPDLASYFAGDWSLNVQFWGDYEEQHPLFRGLGFLPITGFARNDTVVYFQNENGLWRADIPYDVLERAPQSAPVATPQP